MIDPRRSVRGVKDSDWYAIRAAARRQDWPEVQRRALELGWPLLARHADRLAPNLNVPLESMPESLRESAACIAWGLLLDQPDGPDPFAQAEEG